MRARGALADDGAGPPIDDDAVADMLPAAHSAPSSPCGRSGHDAEVRIVGRVPAPAPAAASDSASLEPDRRTGSALPSSVLTFRKRLALGAVAAAAAAGVAAALPLPADSVAGAAVVVASAEGNDERTSLLLARRKRVLLAVAVSGGDVDALASVLRATAVGLSNCAPPASSYPSASFAALFRNRERGTGAAETSFFSAPPPAPSPCSDIVAAIDSALVAAAPDAAALAGVAGADASTVTDRNRDFPFFRTLGAAALPSAPSDDGARADVAAGRSTGASAEPWETAGAVPARARRGAVCNRVPPLTDDSSLLDRCGGAFERGTSVLSRYRLVDCGTTELPSVGCIVLTKSRLVFFFCSPKVSARRADCGTVLTLARGRDGR